MLVAGNVKVNKTKPLLSNYFLSIEDVGLVHRDLHQEGISGYYCRGTEMVTLCVMGTWKWLKEIKEKAACQTS